VKTGFFFYAFPLSQMVISFFKGASLAGWYNGH
jgi:hypothetical protein